MLSLAQAELLGGIIALVFAYIVSVTIIGVGQALVAEWAGDTSPKESGFLSFDPACYVDIFGFICLIIFGFGWGRTIPFNPLHVKNPHRSLRVLLVYLAEPVIALFLAGTALTATLFLLGKASLVPAIQSIFFDSWAHRLPIYHLASVTQGISQAKFAFSIVCIAFVSVNLFLAVWRTIHNACYYALFIGSERGYAYMKHMNVIIFLAPLALLLTVAPYLMGIFLQILAVIALRIVGH